MRVNTEVIFNIKPYFNIKLEKSSPPRKHPCTQKISSTSSLELLNSSSWKYLERQSYSEKKKKNPEQQNWMQFATVKY